MLSNYRVIELADEKGFLCGKISGDLGADVILIENPSGHPARYIQPSGSDTYGREKGLSWLAYNTSKRGITLDLEDPIGKEIFERLISSSDFLIEAFRPGYMKSLGLDYASLSQTNPGLIMVSITPFGQTGPYCNYKDSDLIAMAMGGMLYITGDPDRPPVRISIDQAYAQASAHAAAAMMIALYHRAVTGEGQYIDVSVQQSVVRTLHTQLPYWEYSNQIIRRSGLRRERAGISLREVWQCKDGYVTWNFFGGVAGAGQMRRLVEWMANEVAIGSLGEKVKEWEHVEISEISREEIDSWEEVIAGFFARHSKMELYHEAIRRDVPLSPANTIEDILSDKQLSYRGFFVELRSPETESNITFPGHLHLSNEITLRPKCSAPRLGEHNNEILIQELGYTKEELVFFKERGII